MALVVQKFGGSSLKSPGRIRDAAKRIGDLKNQENSIIVVVSAMGRMTDTLLRLAHKTAANPSQRELDMLVTAGERVSMSLLSMALNELNVPAISFTGSQSGIITSSDHTEARILEIKCHRIEEELAKGKVVIVAGFQGVSREKEITTLGRGGSDTTAVALAAALKADRCEILTDVDGIFDADPRLVPNAKLIEQCCYEQASEMSRLGAKMHFRSIDVARRHNIPLFIGSSARNDGTGTWIMSSTDMENEMESTKIKSIATLDDFVGVSFQNIKLLEGFPYPIRFFVHTSESTKIVCRSERVPLLKQLSSKLNTPIEITPDLAVVSMVGEGLTASATLIPDVISRIESLDCPTFMVSANALSVSAAIPNSKRAAVASNLHAAYVQ